MATILINDFQGGIAQTPESTIANQFAMGQGLDISKPHLLSINQKLKAVGSTELLKAITVGQKTFGIGTGTTAYPEFTASNGVYTYTPTGDSWSLLHTFSNNYDLYNAISFNDYLLACDSYYLRKAYLPFSASTGTYTYNDTVGTLVGATLQNHPIYNDGTYVYIGNGHHLAKYDLTTFSDDIVPLGNQYCITDIASQENYLVILCKPISGGIPDRVYWWDGYSEHYNHKLDLPFSAECFGNIGNTLVIIGDQNGSIYQITPTGWQKLLNDTLLRTLNISSRFSSVKSTVESYANLYTNANKSPSTVANNDSIGTVEWIDPTNISTEDGSCATADLSSTTTTETFTSSDNWICPAGVKIATIECWGGGGGGSGIGTANGNGGGGGGAYSKKNISVIPSTQYAISVGAGGSGGDNGADGANGGDSYFKDSSTVLAKGGSAASGIDGGAGGSATNGVGDIKYSGGTGGSQTGVGYGGGGGGGGAGNAQSGSNGVSNDGSDTGGAGGTGGSTGGGDGGAAERPGRGKDSEP